MRGDIVIHITYTDTFRQNYKFINACNLLYYQKAKDNNPNNKLFESIFLLLCSKPLFIQVTYLIYLTFNKGAQQKLVK